MTIQSPQFKLDLSKAIDESKPHDSVILASSGLAFIVSIDDRTGESQTFRLSTRHGSEIQRLYHNHYDSLSTRGNA